MTTKDTVTATVTKIIQDHVWGDDEPATATLDSTLDDLKFDSLDHVELMMAIEEEFSIDLADEAAERLFVDTTTVQQIVDHVAALVGAS